MCVCVVEGVLPSHLQNYVVCLMCYISIGSLRHTLKFTGGAPCALCVWLLSLHLTTLKAQSSVFCYSYMVISSKTQRPLYCADTAGERRVHSAVGVWGGGVWDERNTKCVNKLKTFITHACTHTHTRSESIILLQNNLKKEEGQAIKSKNTTELSWTKTRLHTWWDHHTSHHKAAAF